MSQAHNHVKWCLAKSKREIEECSKLGKRPKHRGLIQTKPDIDAAKKHLEKAQHNLQATIYLNKGKFSDISASTLFYSMYHCFLSIASKFGYDSRNQGCTDSLMEWLIEEKKINLDMKFVEMLKSEETERKDSGAAINIREEYTYGADISLKDKDETDNLIIICKELIDKAKDIVFS